MWGRPRHGANGRGGHVDGGAFLPQARSGSRGTRPEGSCASRSGGGPGHVGSHGRVAVRAPGLASPKGWQMSVPRLLFGSDWLLGLFCCVVIAGLMHLLSRSELMSSC